jgi:predicted enzyme related to lactoylglutathione lyase
MRIDLTSIMVSDQDKAEKFYTEVLGFQKKVDIPVGEFRWITVVSPEAPDGVQLVLEPNENPVGKAFQQGLYEQGIPATAFTVDNVQQEFERLKGLGVQFTMPPTTEEWGTMARFDDTVGNLIQIQDVTG